MSVEFRRHHCRLTTGITRTPEFERKGLATHAVDPGVRCSRGCLYCSTGAPNRLHPGFKPWGEDLFAGGYAIVDPDTPQRVARDAMQRKKRGLVQLGTHADAWAPEARRHQLGRRCLKAILEQPGWSVRILTKSAAVRDDFDLIEQYRDRVLIGLSLPASPDRQEVLEILEPNASPIRDRMVTMTEAAARGLRTYVMLRPLLPGIADGPDQLDRLVRFAEQCRAEEIFAEPVNPRGPGLRRCQEALELWGYQEETETFRRVRTWANWSRYVADLVGMVQQSARRHRAMEKVRFLLYPSRLPPEDEARIRANPEGVVWLGKD